LDWTESPYVAAFFAFRSIPEGVGEVSIFGYQDKTARCTFKALNSPHIQTLGPFEHIHERHVAQQCWYTYCVKEEKNDSITLCPHEDALLNSRIVDSESGDHLQEWRIDASEREVVLGDLFQMNITPFNLFRSVDSAAETAALRVIPPNT